MSVIAKLVVRNQVEYGTGGRLIELGCLCDNDLMAGYAADEQDKLFTKYSPWGEMKVSQPEGFGLTGTMESGAHDDGGITQPPAFYVMALHASEHELKEQGDAYSYPDANFPGSSAWAYGVCHRVEIFGGDTKRVEFRAGNTGTVKGKGIEKFNWRMSVDNPGASDQFKPGECYYFVLYPAAKFDRNAAIRAAHGHDA